MPRLSSAWQHDTRITADIKAIYHPARLLLRAFYLLCQNRSVVIAPCVASIMDYHVCKVAQQENKRTNIAPGEPADKDSPIPHALIHSESFELFLAGLMCYCMSASVQVLQVSTKLFNLYRDISLLAGKRCSREGMLVLTSASCTPAPRRDCRAGPISRTYLLLQQQLHTRPAQTEPHTTCRSHTSRGLPHPS